MKKRITLNTFRRLERAEETMIRATMPRTSAADSAPLTSPIQPAKTEARRTWRADGSFVDNAGFTFGDAARTIKMLEVARG